jgi:hypothetical protein
MPDLAQQIRDRLDGWAPAPVAFSFPEDWTEQQRDEFRSKLEDGRIGAIPEHPRQAPRTFDYPFGRPAGIQDAETATPEEIEHWQQAWDELLAKGATFHPIKVLPPGPRVYPGFEQMRDALLTVLKKHPHYHAADESSRHVETLGYPHDFGCGKCHASMRGSRDLNGLGWCETVTDIASALRIEADSE